MPVTFKSTSIPNVTVCEMHPFADDRGFFVETYHHAKYAEAGITQRFVQDNYSHSRQGVLRGLHYQLPRAQAKLVSCIQGTVFDVAVDIRQGSPTFSKWVGTILSAENRRQLFIPEGVAHGFCVLSDTADVVYKCTDFYQPGDDHGILWSDPAVDIDWPVRHPILSDKDQALPTIADAGTDVLPRYVS